MNLNDDLKTGIDYYKGDLLKTTLWLLRKGYLFDDVIKVTGYKPPETHVLIYGNSGSWQLMKK